MKSESQRTPSLDRGEFVNVAAGSCEGRAAGDSQPEPLSVTVVTTRGELWLAKERWRALARAADSDLPYIEFEWYAAALATVDRHGQPFVVFVQSKGQDVGLAPLVHTTRHHGGFCFHRFSFINNVYTPEQGFLYTVPFRNFLAQVLGCLARSTGSNFTLDLDELKLSSEEASELHRLSGGGDHMVTIEERSESRQLRLGPTFEQTVAASDKKFRHEFFRKERRLARLGSVKFVTITGREEVERNLDRFFAFYARSWKGAEPNPEFYYSVCRGFGAEAGLYFGALTLDDVPIAYLLGLRAERSVYAVKTTYDPAYYAFSPGVILFYRAIEDCHRNTEVCRFDFGRGDEQYKRDWGTQRVVQYRVILEPNTLFRRTVHALRTKFWSPLKQFSLRKLSRWRNYESRSQLTPNLRLRGDSRRAGRVRLDWPPAWDISMRNGLEARFARVADRDWLAVLTDARNLTQVELRIARQACVVIEKDGHVLACFWMDGGVGRNGLDRSDKVLKITDWSVHRSWAGQYTLQELLKPCITLLQENGGRVRSVELWTMVTTDKTSRRALT